MSVDLVDYSTTLNPSKKITYRTTVRVWDLAEREILKVRAGSQMHAPSPFSGETATC